MARSNQSVLQSFKKINFLAACALALYAFVGFVQVGVAGIAIEWLETYKFLPLTAMFAAICMIFAASGTRDPRYYHPIEWAIVGITGIVVVLNAFLVEVSDFIASIWPYGAIGVLILMMLTGAIIAR